MIKIICIEASRVELMKKVAGALIHRSVNSIGDGCLALKGMW